MLRPQSEVEAKLREFDRQIEAALERSRKAAERIAEARSRLSPEVRAFIEVSAQQPKPYTAKAFFKAIYDRFPSKTQVVQTLVELFQLYLATRAIVWATDADAVEPRPDWHFSGVGPIPAWSPPEEPPLAPSYMWDSQAPVDANESVVDAVFAKEARSRQPKSN